MNISAKNMLYAEKTIYIAKYRSSRKIPLFLSIVIFFGTFIYSYLWSAKMHDFVWCGFKFGYFNPFLIGTAISLLLTIIHLLFRSDKLILTNKRIIGKASRVGRISIPLGAIDNVSSLSHTVCITVGKKTYYFALLKNPLEAVYNIQNQLPEIKSDKKVIYSRNYAKRVFLVLGGIALILILYVCSKEGIFKSSSSEWSWDTMTNLDFERADPQSRTYENMTK